MTEVHAVGGSDRGRGPALQAVVAGDGPPLLLLHAFALAPSAYQGTIDRLSTHHRVIVPWWLRVPDRTWEIEMALGGLARLLVDIGGPPATVIGHSFGGALGLVLAAERPDLVKRLVLVDAMTAPTRRDLARLGRPGRHFLPLISGPGARAFVGTVVTRPRNIARAGWWGFRLEMEPMADAVAASDVEAAVLWARDDSLLPVAWGQLLALRLRAPFLAVASPDGGRVDHDWVFRHPGRFVATLAELDLLGA
ncbi:MAG: alpha/beta hydrolase [Actinobacteria bacterium]|nr:alpha/beta hydrolase [Actinomycetota bacterium]